jgi:hypothetical protein
MRIEYTLPCGRGVRPRALTVKPEGAPAGGAPRLARLIALAHKLDQLVQSGEAKDYAALARAGHISPARLSQILVLLHLAPAIQEYLLFLSAAEARLLTELGLRQIASEPHWERQCDLFQQMLTK